MDATKLEVSQTAVLKVLGYIDLAGDEVRVAETALTASATGRNGDSVLFKGLHDGVSGKSLNGTGLVLNSDGDLNLLGYACRIILLS